VLLDDAALLGRGPPPPGWLRDVASASLVMLSLSLGDRGRPRSAAILCRPGERERERIDLCVWSSAGVVVGERDFLALSAGRVRVSLLE
jgi:hypothetical protein